MITVTRTLERRKQPNREESELRGVGAQFISDTGYKTRALVLFPSFIKRPLTMIAQK